MIFLLFVWGVYYVVCRLIYGLIVWHRGPWEVEAGNQSRIRWQETDPPSSSTISSSSSSTFSSSSSEAQKPKTFRVAAFYAQFFSGRSARKHFLRHAKNARKYLSRHIKKMRNPFSDPFKTIQTLSQPSGPFRNGLDPFKTIRTFQNRPDPFKTVRTLS